MAAAVPGVILAGGLATRMGGGDKGLLQLAERPLIEHVIERLKPQCALLAINANGDAARFSQFALPVLPDSVAGFPGPLAGVLAGLDWASAQGYDAIVTVSQDTPFYPLDLVVRLNEALSSGGATIALAASPDETGVLRRHPTFGFWPVSLRDDLRAALGEGTRKVGLWAEQHGVAIAEFTSRDGFDPFFNVNTPEDLVAARRMLDTAKS